MRDLSLHLLDLIENSVRASARTIAVTVDADASADRLTVKIEDDGPGFGVPPDQAADPFFTTKQGKRTGLGLSLFRAAAERANGKLTLGLSPLGGAMIAAEMQLSHVDRTPLGDIGETLCAVACTNPGIELRVCLAAGGKRKWITCRDAAARAAGGGRSPLAVAAAFSELVRAGSAELWPQSIW